MLLKGKTKVLIRRTKPQVSSWNQMMRHKALLLQIDGKQLQPIHHQLKDRSVPEDHASMGLIVTGKLIEINLSF